MQLKPLADRVVVKPAELESKTKSGIIIPDTAKEKSQKGKVLAVGPGFYQNGNLIPLSLKIGDVVLYKEYGGDEIKLEGEEVMILKADDILAVIEN
jgi:chaperonin GroES